MAEATSSGPARFITAFYRWLWYLVPANPIVLRVIKAGSRRSAHFWARTGYLSALIALMIIGLMSAGGMADSVSFTDLAKSGTRIFVLVAYGQVALICLLAPIFVAGAINEEQSGETIDILLTTPLSNLQIVLGSLVARTFFVIALLLSGLPLFAVLLLFGGVAIRSVFVAFSVAALSAVFVGSVAITIAVMRAGGRKAVFTFVIVVVGFLVVTYATDRTIRYARAAMAPPVATAGADAEQPPTPDSTAPFANQPFPDDQAFAEDQETDVPTGRPEIGGETTFLTPLHPILVLEASIDSANYRPPSPDSLADRSALVRYYMSNPLGAFATLTALSSVALLLFSALQLRAAGQVGSPMAVRLRRWLRITGPGQERRRPPRSVWANPIAWVEANARGNRLAAILGRWGFVAIGMTAGLILLLLYHNNELPALTNPRGLLLSQGEVFRLGLEVLLILETAIIAMVAIYMSAGCVSREREDGTLDLLLTTPVTPKQYVWGKLRGLVSFLSTMLSVPIFTLAIVAIYVLIGQWLDWPQATGEFAIEGRTDNGFSAGSGSATMQVITRPVILPEAAVWFPLMLVPFIALCATVGMNWSIKARGVLGAVIPTLAVITTLTILMGFCGWNALGIPFIGAVLNAFSPATNLIMLLNPWETIGGFAEPGGEAPGRVALFAASLVAAGLYAIIIYSMLHSMVRTFDHTVRRLSGGG